MLKGSWRRLGFPRGVGFLAISIAVVLGMAGGIGSFTFGYGQGFSYMLDDPQACANCHVMQDHFDSWQNSSHHHVATCNDCHLPHDFAGKWAVKADNGFFHSLAFTLENFHEPIQIKTRNRKVTQNACLHCHADAVHNMLPVDEADVPAHVLQGEVLLCMHCHDDVGHGPR